MIYHFISIKANLLIQVIS